MTAGYEALRATSGFVDRRGAGVVHASGPDARSFLENLVSQRVADLGDGEGATSLLLQPTGKLDVAFRVLDVGDDFWLDCEPGYGERLAGSLLRFRIRVDVDIDDVSDAWGVLVVRGPDAERVVESALGISTPPRQHAHAPWNDARVVRADWPGLPGVDLVGSFTALDEAAARLRDAGSVEADEADYEVVRVEVGVPRQGADIDDKTIAQEAFLDRSSIDFDKGCFLGQELVCRIKDRGHVNRHLRRLRITDGSDVPPAGAEVVADGAGVGTLTSVVGSPSEGVVALGYVRTKVEPGRAVVVRWEAHEATGVVEELPATG